MVDAKESQAPGSNTEGEISLKELIIRIKNVLSFLVKKWKLILLFVILGAASGFFLAKTKKPVYKAKGIFVLDEGGGNTPAAMGGLAMLGLNLGSNSSGLFSGTKNILWLYSSKSMIKRALLTTVMRDGKKEVLINWLIEESKLQKALGASYKKDMFLNITDSSLLTPVQNSVILNCCGLIANKYLKVKEEDGTDNMIGVSITSRDELFAKEFAETLINMVNQFYIQSKTMKILEEIAVLQSKADSFRLKMDNSMFQAASAMDAAPNANPNLQVLRVAPQRKRVDVDVSSALYIELTKNLESRRMSLAQETPLIQIIESPSLPLEIIRPSPVFYAVLGGFIVGFCTVALLLIRFFYRKIMA